MLQDSVDQQAPSIVSAGDSVYAVKYPEERFSHSLLSLLCFTFCLRHCELVAVITHEHKCAFVQLTLEYPIALCASCCALPIVRFSSSRPLSHSSFAVLSVGRLCPLASDFRYFETLK